MSLFEADINIYYNISDRKQKLIAINKYLFEDYGDTPKYLYIFLENHTKNRNLHILDFLFDQQNIN